MRRFMCCLTLMLCWAIPAMAGNFYVNMTIKDVTQEQVVSAAMALKRKAFISPAYNGNVVIYDKVADDQDPKEITSLAGQLSKQLERPVFAVLNHDDDELMYWLFDRGQKLDEYDSWPGYFQGAAQKPSGGNPKVLCSVFGVAGVEQKLETILRKPDYGVEITRHIDLLKLLKLPDAAVSVGYRYISEGEHPADFAKFRETK